MASSIVIDHVSKGSEEGSCYMVLLLKNRSLSIQIVEVKKVKKKKQGLGACSERPDFSRMARFLNRMLI